MYLDLSKFRVSGFWSFYPSANLSTNDIVTLILAMFSGSHESVYIQWVVICEINVTQLRLKIHEQVSDFKWGVYFELTVDDAILHTKALS